MATEPYCSCWIVVVATDKYAGNFEREMCAYCTGVVGDCEVGKDLAAGFPHGEWCDRMLQFPDDHGCHRPASIWGGPKFNDVAMFFAGRPSKREWEIIRSRAKEFAAIDGGSRLKILGFKLIKYAVNVTSKVVRREKGGR
jgi:hypothetical protein